ncbi:MAG: prepilin-type N-terminal cleavage/methylation domain-containing protein [Pseudomonadota bacterium]
MGIPGRHRSAGFTLVELSIGLLIMGIIIGVAVTAVTRIVATPDNGGFVGGFDKARIDSAITGFMRANHRLPCPDIDDDGVENCTDGGNPVHVGTLPLATLQVALPPEQSWRLPVAYGIYRGADPLSDLGQASSVRYSTIPAEHPSYCSVNDCTFDRGSLGSFDDDVGDLPGDPDVDTGDLDNPPDLPDLSGLGIPDLSALDSVTVLRSVDTDTLNVLDGCVALRVAGAEAFSADRLHAGRDATAADRVNAAYAMAWSTTPELLGGNDLLESRQSLTNETRFHPPGRMPEGSDDLTAVVSFDELAQALGCTERLGEAALTLQSTSSLMTNEFLNRVRLAHIYIFAQDAQDSVSSAVRDVTFASIDIILATANLLISISESTQGNPVAIANVVVSSLELANSIAALGLAIDALVSAQQFLDSVIDGPLTDAHTRLQAAGLLMEEARDVANTIQQRGQL